MRSLTSYLAVVLLSAGLLFTPKSAIAQSDSVFEATAGKTACFDRLPAEADEAICVALNRSALRLIEADVQVGESREASLPLPTGEVLTLEFSQMDSHHLGATSITGRWASEDAFADAVLTYEGDSAVGSIVTDHGVYRIRKAREGHVLYEVRAPSVSETESDALMVNAPGIKLEAPASGASESTIDLMTVVTAQAQAAIGGNNVDLLMQNWEAWANGALANNDKASLPFRLVRVEVVSYSESSSLSSDLSRITNPSDGYMDQIPALRADVGADLVALIVSSDDGSACGVAWHLGDSNSFRDYGYGVTAQNCGEETFTHELGHNLGMDHDSYVSSGNGFFSYGRGYVNTGERIRTIMAYGSQCTDLGYWCARVQYFSDPTHTYNGALIGASWADNARVLDTMGPTVSGFQASVGGTSGSPEAPTALSASVGDGSVTLSWTAPTSGSVASYRVYRGTSASPTTLVATVSGSATSYTDSGLSNGTTYYYRLKTVDGSAAESGYSTQIAATPAGLVAYYPFTGSADDAGPWGLDGTVSGATLTTDRHGTSNAAYALDGNDYITVPSADPLLFDGTYTVAAWAKVSRFDTGQSIEQHPIVSKLSSNGWSGGFEVMANGGGCDGFALASNIGGEYPSANPWQNTWAGSCDGWSEGEWQHVVGLYNGSQVQLYVNGVQVDDNTEMRTGSPQTSSLALVFGKRSGGGSYWYEGSIDDVRLYNTALSASEIAALYESEAPSGPMPPTALSASVGDGSVTLSWTAPTSGSVASYRVYRGTSASPTTLVATVSGSATSYTDSGLSNGTTYYYRLKTVDGSAAESGYSTQIAATPAGLVAYYPFTGSADDAGPWGLDGTVSGATLTTDRHGTSNAAYALDGNDYITVPSADPLLFDGTYTVAAWAKVSRFDTGQSIEQHPIVSKLSSNGWSGGFEVMANGGGCDGFALASNIGGEYPSANPWQNTWAGSCDGWSEGEWQHVVGLYNGSQVQLYVNGVQVDDNTETRTGSPQTSSLALVFGKRSGGGNYWYEGSIDDVRLYNTALSASEIAALYESEAPSGPMPPTALSASVGDGSVTLSWTAPTSGSVASYRVYRGTSASPTTLVATVSGSATSYTDTGLVNGTTYYYRLTAVDGAGDVSNYTADASATPRIPGVATLEAHYPFDGNANDASGNGWHGTINGATLTTDRFGNTDSAIQFSGEFEHVATAYPGVGGSEARTIMAWVKKSGSNRNKRILTYGGGTGQGGDFTPGFERNHQDDQCGCYPDVYRGAIIDGGHVQVIYEQTEDDTEWHHFAWVVPDIPNPSFADVRIYQNGMLLANDLYHWSGESNSRSKLVNTGSNVALKIHPSGESADPAGGFSLDDLRIYRGEMSESEIASASGNVAPEFASAPVTSTLEESEYRYDVTATDANGDVLVISGSVPSWLTLVDHGTGAATLSGTPDDPEVGDHTITLRVTDAFGFEASQSFTLSVANVNDLPVVVSAPELVATEDVAYSYVLEATDADAEETLTATALLPAWLEIDTLSALAIITGTPTNDDVGVHEIVISVQDGAGSTTTQSFQISVENVNDAPVWTSQPVTEVDEDAPYTYNMEVEDVDSGDSPVLTASLPDWLTMSSTGPGEATLSGTPENGDVGTHQVSVTATDNSGAQVTQAFSISVANTNDAPQITSAPKLDAEEDVRYSHVVSASDPDVGDTISITGSLPEWLTLADAGDGTALIQGTPTVEHIGESSASLSVTDGAGAIATVSFVITVSEVNDAPLALETSAQTNEDTPVTFVLSGSDEEGAALSFSISTPPTSGQAMVSGSTATYTPAPDDNGSFAFQVVAFDGENESAPATVTVTVSPVNDAPTFSSTPPTTASEGALYTYEVTTGDVDSGDTRSISGVLPAWLVLVDNGNGSGRMSGTPTNDHVGDHDVVLTVADAAGASVSQSFVVQVGNVNQAPIFTSAPGLQAVEDQGYLYTVVASDPDVGDALTVSGSTPGWLTLTDAGDGAAVLAGTPLNEHVGTHAVALTVSDLSGAAATQSFTVTVANTNDGPVFTSQPVVVADEDAVYAYTIQTEDVDAGDSRSISTDAPVWLVLTDHGDGSATLEGTPTNAHVGAHDVQVVVADAGGLSAIQSFTIVVSNINDAPVFISQPVESAIEDEPYAYAVSVADDDTGDVIAIDGTLPEWLALTDAGDGTALLAGTPDNAHVGSATVTLVATDAAGTATEQAFTLAVLNTNDVPDFVSQPVVQVDEDRPYRYEIQTSDPDFGDTRSIDGDVPAWLILMDLGDGTATLEGTPDAPEVGLHDVLLRVVDAAGAEATQAFIVEVIERNLAPAAVAVSAEVAEDASVTVVLSGSDPDGDTLTFSIVNPPVHGLATLSDGVVLYEPSPDFNGEDSFSFLASDGRLESAPAEVQITVTPTGVALLQLVNAAGDFSALDLYFGESRILDDFPTGEASRFIEVPDDLTYGIARSFSTGASDVFVTATHSLSEQDRHMGVIYTTSDGRHAIAFSDPIGEAPAVSQVSVRFMNGQSEGDVDVRLLADTPEHEVLETLWSGLAPGQFTDEIRLDVGAYNIEIGASDAGKHSGAGEVYRLDWTDSGGQIVGAVITDTSIAVYDEEGRADEGAIVTSNDAEVVVGDFRIAALYPNPVLDQAVVELQVPTAGTVEFVVYDILGRRMISETRVVVAGDRVSATLDASRLAAGAYVLRTSLGSAIESRLFLVN